MSFFGRQTKVSDKRGTRKIINRRERERLKEYTGDTDPDDMASMFISDLLKNGKAELPIDYRFVVQMTIILYYDEDFRVVEQATRWLPSQKISVSMTGSNITDTKLELLKKVSAVEFTLDNLPEMENPFRPRGYNFASMIAMKKCIAAGIKVRAITVLYQTTISQENLESVYHWLCENAVSEWELLRFYPVGRAVKFSELTPSVSEYLDVMKFLRRLHGSTKIFFQHSLRILKRTIKCSAVVESIGILPGGEVTACAWAMDNNTQPFKEFYLGKLPEDDLYEIIDRAQKIPEYSERTKFCRTIAHIEKKHKEEM